MSLKELSTLIDKISLLALEIPQHKIYLNSLIEHLLSFYQNLLKEKEYSGYEKMIEISSFLLELIEKDSNIQYKNDKQHEYVYLRETKEEKEKLKEKINFIKKEAEKLNIELHVNHYYENESGILTLKDTCQDSRIFHSRGNEIFIGRETQIANTINQILTNETKVRIISIYGSLGSGKTSYGRRLATQLSNEIRADRYYYLQCKGNTEYPMNTLELYQQLIKLWYVGVLPKNKNDLRRLYHQSFESKRVIMMIDDPLSIQQVLSLIPKVYDSKSMIIIIITSRTSLNLEKQTKNQIDLINYSEIIEKKKSEVNKEEEETDSDVSSDEEGELPEQVQDEEEEEEEKKEEEKLEIQYPKRFYLILNEMEGIKLKETVELMNAYNNDLKDEIKTLAVLCSNIPLFLKLSSKMILKYKLDFKDYLSKLSNSINKSNQKYKKFKSICYSFLVENGLIYFKEELKSILFQLTIFPYSFHLLDVSKILNMKMSDFIILFNDLIDLGFIEYSPIGLRYELHDTIRATFSKDLEKDKYFEHYFNKLKGYNNEHEFSGIKLMCGNERYDYDIENIKNLQENMDDNQDLSIEIMNESRYLLNDKIYPEKRGMIYNRFKNVEMKEELKIYYLDGFSEVYRELTDYSNALNWCNKAFELKESLFLKSKIEEVELLSTLKYLFLISWEEKKYNDSKNYLEKMILICQKNVKNWQKKDSLILDPYLGYSYIQLSLIYLMNNDPKSSKKYFEQGIEILKSIYGKIHPEIGESYKKYANLLKNFKKKEYFDQVNEYFLEAIQIENEIFGEKSYGMSELLDDWSVSLLSQSKFKEAEIQLNKSQSIKSLYLKRYDLKMSALFNNLAVALKNLNKIEEAKKYYKESLEIMTKILGENHPQLTVAKNNIGSLLTTTGETEEAQKYFKETNIENQDPKVMATLYNNQGDNYRNEQNFEKAFECYEKSLTIRKELSKDPSNDIELSKTLISIGKLSIDKQQYDKGIELLNEALNIILNAIGKSHPNYSSILIDIAGARFKQKKFDESEKIFLELLNHYKENKESMIKIYPVLQNLAVCMDGQKKYSDSESYYKQVINYLKEELINNKNDKALKQKYRQAVQSLASNLGSQKKFEEGEHLYQELSELIKEEFNEKSVNYADSCKNYGACLVFNKKYEEAEKQLSKAVVLFEEILGPDHDQTLSAKEALEEVRNLIYSKNGNNCCCLIN